MVVDNVNNGHEELTDNIRRIEIQAGCGKDGSPEPVPALQLSPGDVVCLVGKTGAGKTQLLDDLGVLAQGDTPSGRRVLIDGRAPTESQRYRMATHLVAHLSQNMQFVMDLPVRDFLVMHAESRQAQDPCALADETIACANDLAGETFRSDTPLAALSGGQSRALMVADVALLSAAPIVLLDEIENAGIDKHRALSLLAQRRKITLVSTHDPVIALMGDRRVVVANGAMTALLETSDRERQNLASLCALDDLLLRVRAQLRAGDRIDADIWDELAATREDTGEAAEAPGDLKASWNSPLRGTT